MFQEDISEAFDDTPKIILSLKHHETWWAERYEVLYWSAGYKFRPRYDPIGGHRGVTRKVMVSFQL
jgi:hypothetical protein